jgi:hypothetical protein
MKQKIKTIIFTILAMLVIIGIARESIARKPTEVDFYKKYCGKSNDKICEQIGRNLW